MELLLSLFGIAISVRIAWWEYRRANRAEALLNKTITELPNQLVADIGRMLATPGVTESESRSLDSRHADLNGDGKDELLVSYLSGPHNIALQVFWL